jgi:hypothetical protein
VLNMAVLSSSIVVLSGLLSMISGKLLHIKVHITLLLLIRLSSLNRDTNKEKRDKSSKFSI